MPVLFRRDNPTTRVAFLQLNTRRVQRSAVSCRREECLLTVYEDAAAGSSTSGRGNGSGGVYSSRKATA